MFPNLRGGSNKIVDYRKVTTIHITSFNVSIRDVVLNTSATLVVQLFDSNNKIIEVKNLILTGQDYDNWGADDKYIINYVANKLGFTLINHGATGATGP